MGRTSPSIYLHFPDKASLMWAVCERHYADHEASMAAAAEGIADPLERLASLARAYVRFAVDNPEQFRILFLTDRTKLGGAATLEDLGQTQGFALVAEAVAEAAADGTIVVPDGDVLAVLVDLWAAVQGIATLLVTRPQGGLPGPEVWVDRFLRLVLDGLRPR